MRAKQTKKKGQGVVKRGTVGVVVITDEAIHPDDRRYIMDRLRVEKDHMVYVVSDEPDYLSALCDDLSLCSNVTIHDPNGSFAAKFILAKLGFLAGLGAMDGAQRYAGRIVKVYLPIYELSNTNDLVVTDIMRVV